jgi:hypothetical protein
MRHRRARAWALLNSADMTRRGLLLLASTLAACGGASPPPSCSAAASQAPDGSFPASGSFVGSDLNGAVCTDGAYGILEQTSGSISVPSQLEMYIDTGNGSGNCRLQSPSGATDCNLEFSAAVAAAAPGTYASSDGGGCDSLVLNAIYPTLSVDCQGVVYPAQCPAGCSYGITAASLPAPCVPTPGRQIGYVAQAGGNCLDTESYSKLGSWTLTLTSVAPEDSGRYAAHGSLDATVVTGYDLNSGAINGPVATATLSMTF